MNAPTYPAFNKLLGQIVPNGAKASVTPIQFDPLQARLRFFRKTVHPIVVDAAIIFFHKRACLARSRGKEFALRGVSGEVDGEIID